jgi:enoyl-CoA hydratase/carnithine racemase
LSDIVKYEQEGAVAVITLHRPESMNSFNGELRAETCNAFSRAHDVLFSPGRVAVSPRVQT